MPNRKPKREDTKGSLLIESEIWQVCDHLGVRGPRWIDLASLDQRIHLLLGGQRIGAGQGADGAGQEQTHGQLLAMQSLHYGMMHVLPQRDGAIAESVVLIQHGIVPDC